MTTSDVPTTTADTPASGSPKRRTGGRSARVQQAVFAATIDALRNDGYAGLGISDIARRSNVHETSIYRRWGSKPVLVTAALRELAVQSLPVPNTGDLREDLFTFLLELSDFLRSPIGTAMVQLNLMSLDDDELRDGRQAYWNDRFDRVGGIIDRAVVAGQLPADVDRRLLIQSLAGVVHMRVFLTDEPLDVDTLHRLVALVLEGASRPSSRGDQPSDN